MFSDRLLGDLDSVRLNLENKNRRPVVARVLATEPKRKTPCALNIIVSHDEPDLNQTIPTVPG